MVGDYRDNYSKSSDDSSSVEEETTSSMYSARKEDTATEWTDEKHSLYLKSMEASFVDQLYNSLGLLGSKNNKDTVGPSSRRFDNGGKPSQEQFKVLRDGFWQKMNVRQPEYRPNGRRGRGSHEFLRSPWIKHYKPSPKTLTDKGSSGIVSSKGIVICSSGLREGCSHSRDRDQISVGEEEEVSDQNFVNEVTKCQNGSSKKMKTVMSESASTDQVVPLRQNPANMIT
ncbi:Cold-regulated protein 27 [Hirschfeldia incana]|nr:Cold-regulated protein 27 [Hirschfeldia incana]